MNSIIHFFFFVGVTDVVIICRIDHFKTWQHYYKYQGKFLF